jgi:dihydroorotate dehydrogenase subfamily 1
VVNKTLHLVQNWGKMLVRPRYYMGKGYMLNCERGNELPWKKWKTSGVAHVAAHGCLILSLGGMNIEECVRLVAEFEPARAHMYEINLSCPHSGRKSNIDVNYVTCLVEALRRQTQRPLLIKVGYSQAFVDYAMAAEQAGADAICTTNSIGPGMAIDVQNGRPHLGILGGAGGVSGPAIKSIALYCVVAISRAVQIPVIGCGGVSCANDVVEMVMAGAAAVQIYTHVHIHGPAVFEEINTGLMAYLTERNLPSLSAVYKVTHAYLDTERHGPPRPRARRWKGFQSLE